MFEIMKNLITLLLVITTLNSYSQSPDYVKSSIDANIILYEKFKDHRENHGYYGKALLNTEGSDIIFHKALWQSRGHFASHNKDPNDSWWKSVDHSVKIANENNS